MRVGVSPCWRQSASCIGVYGSDDGLAWDNLGPDDGPVFKVREQAIGSFPDMQHQVIGCASCISGDPVAGVVLAD
jgi:hypothetical protein